MSHIYTPSPVPISNTTLPDDDDLASAVSVNTPLEDVLDGVKYSQDAIGGTSVGTMTPQDINVGGGLLVVTPSEVTAGTDLVSAGPFTAVSTSHLIGGVTCDSTLHVVGALTCSSVSASTQISVTGSFSANTTSIICLGYLGLSGGIVQRTFNLNDADQTVSVADGDVFYMPNLSADRVYGISMTGAIDGWWIRFVAHDNVGGFKGSVTSGFETVQMAAHAPISGVTQTTSTDWRMVGGIWKLEQRVAWY